MTTEQVLLGPKEKKILVRREAKSSQKYGSDPYLRSVEELIHYSIINVNKPKGPTSHQVSSYVQKILGIGKSGHSGTLDPKVTGVLPVALDRATRVVEALLKAGKEYVGIMHVHQEVPEVTLRKVLQQFVGRIKQLPPIKSSVKREWRFRNIYYFEILEIEGKEVLFRVGCQAGTYIRKLIHDMGQALETGANMAKLVRTKAGPFVLDDAWTLQDLTDALWLYKNEKNEKFIRKVLRPIEEGVSHLPKIWVLDSTVDSLCHGSSLGVPGIAKVEAEIQKKDVVAILTLKNELIGLGESGMISKEMVQLPKGIAVKMDKVFMERGTYPKMQKSD